MKDERLEVLREKVFLDEDGKLAKALIFTDLSSLLIDLSDVFDIEILCLREGDVIIGSYDDKGINITDIEFAK